jgi:hypothetical protein
MSEIETEIPEISEISEVSDATEIVSSASADTVETIILEPETIYSKPKELSLFSHRKIPDELCGLKCWDQARERLVTTWRGIFAKNFQDRWMWIDVVYDSTRNGWYKVFVHMWCETNRSLFMCSKVLAGEVFEPTNWMFPTDIPGAAIQVYKTGARFKVSKCNRPKTFYMHTMYCCPVLIGEPKQCMCCEVEYSKCPNGGVVPNSY